MSNFNGRLLVNLGELAIHIAAAYVVVSVFYKYGFITEEINPLAMGTGLFIGRKICYFLFEGSSAKEKN